MATIVCSNCSGVILVNGRAPRSCPQCGHTLDNAADVTKTLDRPAGLPETIIDPQSSCPRSFGRYEIESILGSGGFGTVYLARDPRLVRPVAIKVPHAKRAQSPESVERFEREGRNAAQLRHPGIVSVYNVEEDRDCVFIVSEYVEGDPLSSQLAKGRSSFRAAASIVGAVASAVEYAHSKGIIHRDIKPANIMIDAAGNPRLMDFGLAKHEESDPTVTAEQQVLGTPAYMSPEQARGKPDEIDRRTDVYSLGAVLYHLLTHRLPFSGEVATVRHQVLTEEPTRPRMIDKRIPIDLETICLKAMEKDTARRYQTARELADDLERWLRGEPIVARHISPVERSWRWCRRNPAPAGLVASIALFLVALAAGSGLFAAVQASARRNADNARKETEVLLEKERELLSRAYVEKGSRYLNAPQFSDAYDPIKALPWAAEAAKLDEHNSERLYAGQLRLQLQLDCGPRIERMWFFKGSLQAAGVSPKRDTFFVAGHDGAVNVWRTTKDGPPAFQFAHPGPVRAGAFSPDGTVLATAAEDGLRLWSLLLNKQIAGPLIPHATRGVDRRSSANQPTRVVFSKSGKWIFSTFGLQGQIWDVAKGAPVGDLIDLRTGRSYPETVDFADSDHFLLLTRMGQSTRIYDVQTGKEKYTLARGRENSFTGKLSPDGLTIASADNSGNIVLWNARTGQKKDQQLTSDTSTRHDTIAFSQDGKFLAAGSGSEDGTVRMWSTADGQLLWKRQVVVNRVDQLCFSRDGSLLAVASPRKKLCTIDVQSGNMVAEPIAIVASLYSVHWADSPEKILTFGQDGIIRLWNVESHLPAFALPHAGAVRRTAVSADRRVVATAESGTTICILRTMADGQFEPSAAQPFSVGDGSSIDAITLTGDGSRIAVSGLRQVSIWDTVTRTRLIGPLLHSEKVVAMQFTPDASLLVCVSSDARAAVWDVATGRKLYQPVNISHRHFDRYDIDIDRDGKRCAVAAIIGVGIWDLATGQRVEHGFVTDGLPRFARFVNDPAFVLLASRTRPIQLCRIATGEPICAIDHRSVLECIDVSSDKRQFLAGMRDGRARLWSTQNGAPVSPPFEHPSIVVGGIIDPMGRWVLTFTADRQAFLWDAKSAELLTVISLRHFDSRLGNSRIDSGPDVEAPLGFFAADGSAAHVVTNRGVFISIGLIPEQRPPKQFAADIAVRSGAEVDGAGGMRYLEPQELAARWEAVNSTINKARPQSSIPGLVPISNGEKAAPAGSQLSRR